MEDEKRLRRRCARERKGRKSAENIAENALRELFEKNNLLKELTERIEEQNRILQETQREMEVDLITAEGVQQQLFLDYALPSFLNISTRYLPHTHVSGDIYRLSTDNQSRFNLFLGDSTGHGVTAALSTIMAHILLGETDADSPGVVLDHLNGALLELLPDGRFMTAAQLQITEDGHLTAALAGHPPLIIIPADGSRPVLLSTDCTVLGVFPAPIFEVEETTYQMRPGDKGLLYTDGITERVDADGQMFGEEKLCAILHEMKSLSPDPMLTDLLEHLEEFAGGIKNNDDVTLVAFEYVRDLNDQGSVRSKNCDLSKSSESVEARKKTRRE